MNILILLPDMRFKDQFIIDWQMFKPSTEKISILCLKNEKGSNFENNGIYFLEYDFNKYESSISNFIVNNSSWDGLLKPIWKKIIKNHFIEFIFCIRSFDPDVVDIRSLNFGPQLIDDLQKELHPIRIIFDDQIEKSMIIPIESRTYNSDLKVSIVLPVFNGEKFVRESIESCIKQTHRNLEIIIVDDCSTDKTPEILDEYKKTDSRIKIIRNNSNLRLPGALNVGFSHSTGDLLTWTSDDNYFDPDAIEFLVRYLCTWQDIDFVYSAFRLIDECGNFTGKTVFVPPPYRLRYHNPVGPYFLYRKSIYKSVGDFDPEMEYLEDYDYWVRIYRKKFKMMCLKVPKYNYRHHAGSMTSQAQQNGNAIWEKVRIKYFS